MYVIDIGGKFFCHRKLRKIDFFISRRMKRYLNLEKGKFPF